MRISSRAQVFVLLQLLLLASLASLFVGVSGIRPGEVVRALALGDSASGAYRIFVHVRLPRLMSALAGGSALALSGALLQSVLMNALASPGLLGVSSGAALGALIASVAAPARLALTPVAAFLGALGAAALVYALSALAGVSKRTLVLAGIAASSVLGAVMDLIVSVLPDAAVSRAQFGIGSFSGATMGAFYRALPFLGVALFFVLAFRRELSVLSLGDEVARPLGLPVGKWRALFLAAAALLAGTAVSLAGLIPFVGLLAPHLARQIVPGDAPARLPVTLILGALLCVLCDFLARTLFMPYELPVGALLSLIGGPFLVWMLIRQKRSARHAQH